MSDPDRADRAAELLTLDLFAVLGVPRTANSEELKKGYLAMVKNFHPDRAPSDDVRAAFTKAFARIELAKATLMDPSRRARYLDELARPGSNSQSDRSAAEATFEHAKAEAYLKTNDRARAETHIQKALKLAPDNVDYAVLHVAVRATDAATPTLLMALATELDHLLVRAPSSERALTQRAQVRKRLGRTSEAMADFARVLDISPTNIEAARELRIHKMRAQDKPAPSDEGLGGFFRGLFKRRSS
jgi:tetratricopeptide (TPR) repeat protein